MSVTFKVIIPTRFGSTRLPGKPLLPVAGRPLLAHVIDRARQSRAEEILVATDDQRIMSLCAELGVVAELTDPNHRSGTDRIAEVCARRGLDDETLIVNLQGDEPCMPPELIDQVAEELASRPGVGMATLAYPLTERAALFDPHRVKVVADIHGRALYFSRAPIPWHREGFGETAAVELSPGFGFWGHLGLYAYRVGFLRRFVALAPAPLELAESLEQLRALWHGLPIQVGYARALPGPGVDTPDDLRRAEVWLELGKL
ncbi:3-deoxy-manno-octulosonate cytidylyltransferase [Caldichromatium japonicum]|uniref:3-deoxy-manno-octulosonate cytidylyltransferase n=1 Tax=Caldichromatium japonicum TaxID=2699430 RepID=A0A6G7VC24_9GAMM|nr:3-deoxy-manno-octulosonate cytidylyltransferase [Caldichromatium japonicum]QIK37426.1 3-deoxy-manno-octulosonate cytidylyltransferase [Caldichromatium japonicum]